MGIDGLIEKGYTNLALHAVGVYISQESEGNYFRPDSIDHLIYWVGTNEGHQFWADTNYGRNLNENDTHARGLHSGY